MDELEEAPDLTKPIDTYFAKQERCLLLLVNSEYPIQEHTMILKATQHLGKNPSLSKKSVKFCKLKKRADLENTKHITVPLYVPSSRRTSASAPTPITRSTPSSRPTIPKKQLSRRRGTALSVRCPNF